jgi:hypothetical protein
MVIWYFFRNRMVVVVMSTEAGRVKEGVGSSAGDQRTNSSLNRWIASVLKILDAR